MTGRRTDEQGKVRKGEREERQESRKRSRAEMRVRQKERKDKIRKRLIEEGGHETYLEKSHETVGSQHPALREKEEEELRHCY